MLSALITIYIFDDDEFSGEIVDDNPTSPKDWSTYNVILDPRHQILDPIATKSLREKHRHQITEMKVKIDEEKILNEINKKLLLLIKNEAVSV